MLSRASDKNIRDYSLTIEIMSQTMKCPMCDHVLSWNSVPKIYKEDEPVTHIYICPECPFVGLEYYNDKNIEDLKVYLNR